MTTKAVSTRGLALKHGDGGGPETFTTVGEVTSLKGPTESAPTIDVTSFDSTGHEFIAALPMPGTVDFDMNYVGSDAQQQALRVDLRAGTRRNFKIVASDQRTGGTKPTTITFTAVVTKMEFVGGGIDQALKGSGSLQISGNPVWDYAD
jgi:hypothetical protein